MRVKELIEGLQKLDPEMEILAETEGGEVKIIKLKIIEDYGLAVKDGYPEYEDAVLICTDWSSALPYADDTDYEV